MPDERTQWFRTGAAARMLGTSRHTILALAKAGLIESEIRNGYRYIPDYEIERLQKEGLPPVPTAVEVEDHGPTHVDESPSGRGDTRPFQRSRLAQELYREPSARLARAKENLIEQQIALEAKRLRQESAELERRAKEERRRVREERQREREAEQEQAWRNTLFNQAFRQIPSHRWPEVCSEVESVLKGAPYIEVRTRIQGIIDRELQAEHSRRLNEQLDLLRACAGLRPRQR